MADINILTGLMKTEFLRSMQASAIPAPYKMFTTQVGSTQRIERYPWMYPPPRISRYMGRRRKARLGQIRYDVPNFEWDATLTVPIRDLEDDQYGGHRLRMAQMMSDSREPFESRTVLKLLADGANQNCFDGTPFFGSSHAIGAAGAVPAGFGGGGNLLTYTASGTSDGTAHKCAFLIHGGQAESLKPLLYQLRKPFRFYTDAGTPLSQKAMEADYWVHGEANAAYGYWWDAILFTITNTPGLLDIFTIIDAARQTFRRFTLPRNLPQDELQRVHEQFVYSPANTTIVTDTYMESLFNHVLNEERIGVAPNTLATGTTAGFTNNIYRGKFNLVQTAFFDLY